MKWQESLFRVWVGLTVVSLLAACTGSSDTALVDPPATTLAEDAPTVEPTVAAAVATPTAEPTATVAPVEATDADRVAAAIQALDSNGASDLIAWDVLQSQVDADGLVRLTLCGWTGETVFDDVYESRWLTTATSQGVEVSEAGTSKTAGECLNTHLVETALAFTREYDDFYAEVIADPASFATDPRARELFAERSYHSTAESFAALADDSITGIPGGRSGRLPAGAENEILLNRKPGQSTIGIVACVPMNPANGLYRDGVLIDDFRDENSNGPHSIHHYFLDLGPGQAPNWQIVADKALSWSDCLAVDDWVNAVSSWSETEPWQAIP